MPTTRRWLAAGLVILSLSSAASAQITQPAQPKKGPGSSDYPHADWRVSEGGTGADAWYVFEPIDPQPKSAPLAVIMHGYYEFEGYDSMWELIRHTVRKGNVVIYPRWQTDIVTPCPGPLNIEPCLTSAVNGINGGIGYLQADPTRVQPKLSKTSYFGFSFGGIVTANLMNRWEALGLPKPRAIFLEDPHDGGFENVGLDEPALDDSLAGIPPTVKLQCHTGQRSLMGANAEVTTCNAVFKLIGHIPAKNKDLVMTYDDTHGDPDLRTFHGVCAGRRGLADAYSWNFCWKVWDAMRSCAYSRKSCKSALGPGKKHSSIGKWSDGTPITPLKIQDEGPILP